MKLKPPEGMTNVEYGGHIVPPEGIEVADADVESLKAEGWTEVSE